MWELHYVYSLTDQFLVMAEGAYAQVSFQETVTPDGEDADAIGLPARDQRDGGRAGM